MPFSTAMMATFVTYKTALILYWLNILILGIILLLSWRYAREHNFVDPDTLSQLSTSIEKRIVLAQCLYAIGAILCIFNTYLSLGFTVLAQLDYVLAPRLGKLDH